MNGSSNRVLLTLLAPLVLTALAGVAPAGAATFRLQAGTEGTCNTLGIDATESQGFRRTTACSNGLGFVSGEMRADFGTLGVTARAASSLPSQAIVQFTVAEFDDTVTFTSSNSGQTSTLAALNLHLTGLFSNSGFTGGTLESAGQFGNAQFQFVLSQGSTPTSLIGLSFISGVLNAPAGQTDARLRTASVVVPLGVPVRFQMTLKARSFSVNPGNFAHTEFGDTFEVPLDANAFELPAGVTANSGTWLVDNRRVSVVPEPAAWAMMLAGLGIVSALARRRRSPSQAEQG